MYDSFVAEKGSAMWSFCFNHGSQWVVDNLFKEGFMSEYEGHKLRWHITDKTSDKNRRVFSRRRRQASGEACYFVGK